jgi:predicted kinase
VTERGTGRLIVISGPSAAGKTTVGRAVAGQLPLAVHIDGDAIQRFVVSGSVLMDIPPPPGATEQLWLRYRAALSVAALYRRSGFDAVVTDNIFETGWPMFLTLGLTSAGGSERPVFAVMLDPAIDVLQERYRGRPGGGYTDSLTPEGLKAAVARTPRVGLWLDTSGQTVEESAAEILGRLDEAAVTVADLSALPADENA